MANPVQDDVAPAIADAEARGLSLDSADSRTTPPRPPDQTGRGLSSLHFIAGALGGAAGSLITCPFDMVKTRLQSDAFKTPRPREHSTHTRGVGRVLWHFVETGQILRDVARQEGPTALFRGLGPLLVGVVPARAINFSVYGNGKVLYSNWLHDGQESAVVHLLSATTAGLATGTATNPIWVVKTRLQLQKRQQVRSNRTAPPPLERPDLRVAPSTLSPTSAAHLHTAASSQEPAFRSSIECIRHIVKNEGIRGFYRGLTASYLGVAETALQWTLYEHFKKILRRRASEHRAQGTRKEGAWGLMMAAGGAKLIATTTTYPHEVLRTRMRQAPLPGQPPKYSTLARTMKLVYAEEGLISFYAGLSPHLMRTVPNACVMYLVYEFVMHAFGVPTTRQ